MARDLIEADMAETGLSTEGLDRVDAGLQELID
jgi:hypothetical protein